MPLILFRNVIKCDNLSKTSLDDIREILSDHFKKPKTFFDKYKNEVNQLIVETLKDMYAKEPMEFDIKSEEPSVANKRTADESTPSSAEASPKRTKQMQGKHHILKIDDNCLCTLSHDICCLWLIVERPIPKFPWWSCQHARL